MTGFGILLLFTGALRPAGRELAAHTPPLTEWDIKITVSVTGEYGIDGQTRISGHYQLKFDWTGGLDWDGDDFVLLQGRNELVEWMAEESAVGPGGIRIMTTSDFDERPELNVAYVLRHGGGLHVSLIVRGYGIPRSLPNRIFYLYLPASAESQERPAGLNYNLFVKTGSNAVVLDDPAGSREPQEKKFHWTWVRRAGISEIIPGLFQTNRHEADVTVTLTPAK